MNQDDQHFDTPWMQKTKDLDTEDTTPEIERKFEKQYKDVTEKIQSSVSEILETTGDITFVQEFVKKALKEKSSGSKIQKSDKKLGKLGMNGSEKTKDENLIKSSPGVTRMIQPESLTVPLIDLSQASSDSMSLLDNSAKKLYGSLQSMIRNEDISEDACKRIDAHTILVATKVAHEITGLVRLKLDILKFAKTFQEKK